MGAIPQYLLNKDNACPRWNQCMIEPVFEYQMLQAIGWPWPGPPADPAWRAMCEAYSQSRPARVIEQHRSGYVVAEAPEVRMNVESPPAWQRRSCSNHERAVVGDWVLLEHRRIVALLPRRTVVKRLAAGEHYRQQMIAANLDTAFIVCGLDGDFNPRRIERYCVLIGSGGVESVVVLTKVDMCVDVAAAIAVLREHSSQAVVAVDAREAEPVAALRPWLLPGRTVALVGSSGAGKSTLINTLLGELRMKVGAVRQRDSRGRHTTTHRALLPLPSGACLIDTPGMRELKLTGDEDLVEAFADIESLALQCRFRDCAHQAEPGCAVRAAVACGTLDPTRLRHYLKLRGEIAGAGDRSSSRCY